MRIGTCNIDIPPGAAHHVVHDEYTLPVDVDIHSVFPQRIRCARRCESTRSFPMVRANL